MKYQIYYHYNNGTTYKEEVSAPNAIKALKKAGAHNYLKNVMFQNGSKGTAKAYEIYEDGNEATSESATLYCSYSCTGKWHARYNEE